MELANTIGRALRPALLDEMREVSIDKSNTTRIMNRANRVLNVMGLEWAAFSSMWNKSNGQIDVSIIPNAGGEPLRFTFSPSFCQYMYENGEEERFERMGRETPKLSVKQTTTVPDPLLEAIKILNNAVLAGQISSVEVVYGEDGIITMTVQKRIGQ